MKQLATHLLNGGKPSNAMYNYHIVFTTDDMIGEGISFQTESDRDFMYDCIVRRHSGNAPIRKEDTSVMGY